MRDVPIYLLCNCLQGCWGTTLRPLYGENNLEIVKISKNCFKEQFDKTDATLQKFVAALNKMTQLKKAVAGLQKISQSKIGIV